jgi:hypothetical protein
MLDSQVRSVLTLLVYLDDSDGDTVFYLPRTSYPRIPGPLFNSEMIYLLFYFIYLLMHQLKTVARHHILRWRFVLFVCLFVLELQEKQRLKKCIE